MSNNQFYISENNVSFKELFIYGLSVDCVIFGYYDNNIQVLLIERGAEPCKHQWALLGDLVNNNENFKWSAKRILKKLTGLTNIYLEQFFAFGSPKRHPSWKSGFCWLFF